MSDPALALRAETAVDDAVLYEQRDGIARVTLNRPKRLNSLNPAMTAALLAAFIGKRPARFGWARG